MEIEEVRKNNGILFKIAGKLDLNASYQLESILDIALSKSVVIKTILLDMSKVDYISSAALRVILSTQKRLKSDQSFVIKNPSDFCQKIFSITGADLFLQIEVD